MLINGIEVHRQELSYGKILINTLEQSGELTVRFINGLFGDTIPPGAAVTWIGTEHGGERSAAFAADAFLRIGGSLYYIETANDGGGDTVLRIFKYAFGGNPLESAAVSDADAEIMFPQPCVIILTGGADTPKTITWNITFSDGRTAALNVPVTRLADLSAEEIARRDLLPIGQFYLRTVTPLTNKDTGQLIETAASLLKVLKAAVGGNAVPYYIGAQMQAAIRETLENAIARAGGKVDADVPADIIETLPWVDYAEVFRKLEDRGRAEGRAEGIAEGISIGRAERDREITSIIFGQLRQGVDITYLTKMLSELGVSDEVIRAAYTLYGADMPQLNRYPSG